MLDMHERPARGHLVRVSQDDPSIKEHSRQHVWRRPRDNGEDLRCHSQYYVMTKQCHTRPFKDARNDVDPQVPDGGGTSMAGVDGEVELRMSGGGSSLSR